MLYLLMTAALGQTAADADGVDEILAAEVLGFREGQAEPTSTAPLDEVAELLRLHGDLRVEVGGHTARHDDAAADQAVSQRRADAVVAALVARGVSADRLTARGYGSTVSLFSNRTPEGRSQNERVQFRAIREGVLDVSLAGGGWATVELDGRWLPRAAPLTGFPVQVGHHRLIVSNSLTGLRYEVEVDVRVGETTSLVVPAGSR